MDARGARGGGGCPAPRERMPAERKSRGAAPAPGKAQGACRRHQPSSRYERSLGGAEALLGHPAHLPPSPPIGRLPVSALFFLRVLVVKAHVLTRRTSTQGGLHRRY